MATQKPAEIRDAVEAGTSELASAKPQALGELMLAMDVVDTIRHRELLVERALNQGARDAALRDRLRDIYEGQGIAVTDRVIDEGIQALKDSRFVYTPPPPSFARSLALIWINRGRIAAWIAAVAVAVPLLWLGYSWDMELRERAAQVAEFHAKQEAVATERTRVEREQLPGKLQQLLADAHTVAASVAIEARATSRTETLYRQGLEALAAGDMRKAKAKLAALDEHAAIVAQSYIVRIVSGRGVRSTVYRRPYPGRSLRDYYIIVEAIGENGRPLAVPIFSEEAYTTREVTKWGIRVSKFQYDDVRRDRGRDGIVDKVLVGVKKRGYLTVDYSMPVTKRYITKW